MPSINFYFQVHQPYRVRHCSYLHSPKELDYFDEDLNSQVMKKVSAKCYLPTNRKILELINKYCGDFRVAYSITGVAIEQMLRFSPETLDSFKELADTGCVEFIGETYYHSLSALYSPREFQEQVRMHSELMYDLFGQRPTVFRNTELIYDDNVGRMVRSLGFKAMIAEGCDDVLGWKSPNFVYNLPGSDLRLLLKNYRLSDDIAFRFSNREWKDFPLTADKFAGWVHRISGCGDLVNLFMDYETFGEHQWESTGIFEFLHHLPEAVLRHPDWSFVTPSEAVETYPVADEIHFHRLTSWADADRDLSAWRGNKMQNRALRTIYSLEEEIRDSADSDLLNVWRKLQTSDHFYYMCTKWFADGDVHAYFSPYESPYDAYIFYMNALAGFTKEMPIPSTLEVEKIVAVSEPEGIAAMSDNPLPLHISESPIVEPTLSSN